MGIYADKTFAQTGSDCKFEQGFRRNGTLAFHVEVSCLRLKTFHLIKDCEILCFCDQALEKIMRSKKIIPIVASLFAVSVEAGPNATAQTNESWYPSAYGAADEIGAANLLTPDLVLKAVKLVTTGKVYSLAIPIDSKLPAFRHRSFKLYNIQPGQQAGATKGPNKFTFNDELVEAWTGIGTQLNGIGHIGINNVYYNGNKAVDFVTVEGVKKLGVEKVPPFVTRGVVLDMTAHYGKPIVPGGTEFTVADIKAVLKKQSITLQKGDVVLFHTGWLDLIGKDNKQFLETEPGIGMAAAEWLASLQIVAFGGDTWASEVYPNPSGEEFPVNQFMLAKKGIYNLELIDSRALVRDRAWEFLFILGHPLYKGSTQVNVNPIAIK